MTYIDKFNALATTQSRLQEAEELCLWLPVDEARDCDIDDAVLTIRRSLKQAKIRPEQLVGRSFNVVTGASQALLAAGIKHTITLGDLAHNNSSYFNNSAAEIARELGSGYIANEVASAHAWLTLEDGTVLDLTILPSIALKKGRKLPKLVNAIYRSDQEQQEVIEHRPYHLGIEYIAKVMLEPNEVNFNMMYQWAQQIDLVLAAEH